MQLWGASFPTCPRHQRQVGKLAGRFWSSRSSCNPLRHFGSSRDSARPSRLELTLKVTGPNLGEAYLRAEKGENGRWRASVRLVADGPDVSADGLRHSDFRRGLGSRL